MPYAVIIDNLVAEMRILTSRGRRESNLTREGLPVGKRKSSTR